MAFLVCERALLSAANEAALNQNIEADRGRVLRYVACLCSLSDRKGNEAIVRSVVAIFQFQTNRSLLWCQRPPSRAPQHVAIKSNVTGIKAVSSGLIMRSCQTDSPRHRERRWRVFVLFAWKGPGDETAAR